MAQLTYSISPARAIAGMIAHVMEADDIVSAVNAEASAEIPFGVFVKAGTAERTALLLSASTDKPLGVVVWRKWYEKTLDLGTTGVKAGVRIDVMRKGRIWVTCETAMALADGVHIRYGGAPVPKGAVRNATVASETIDGSKIAKPVTVLAAAGLVALDVDVTAY
jgi:hypothetical protein